MRNESNYFDHPLSVERSAVTLIFAVAVLFVTPLITMLLLRRTGTVRRNFRGENIPTTFGLSIVISSVVLLAIAAGESSHAQDTVLKWVAVVLCFGALGFVDDYWGDKEIKGLKGHLSAALVNHRITSGLIKAIGGIVIGLFIGNWVYSKNPVHAAGAGLLIALSANGMNLLDLRPGRACAVFLFCSTVLLGASLSTASPRASELLLIFVVLPTPIVWILDSRAKVMLGDTGSNALGAALGLGIVESRSIALQAVMAAILIALHIVAERRSITTIIANNKLLDALDKLSGLR